MLQDTRKLLSTISEKLEKADSFYEAMPEIEPDLLAYLQSERVTVYTRGRHTKEIVAKYKSGEDLKEIRVPLSTTSIAGYVALSQKALTIEDVYNERELKLIHEDLEFNKDFDVKSGFRTQSMLVIPIKYKDVFLGVLQALNKESGLKYNEGDIQHALEIAEVLGQNFRYELRGTKSPYDHLVISKKISGDKLKSLLERAQNEGATPEDLIVGEGGITRSDLGESYSRYYQVPFMGFDPYHTIPAELMKGINIAYLRQTVWVPVEGSRDGEVTILIDDPSNASKIMEIQRTLPAKSYAFKVGFKDDILKYLGQGGGSGAGPTDLKDLVGKLQEEIEDVETIEEDYDEANEDEATVIQLVNKIIVEAFKERASDIHIEPGKGKTNATVRIRVDGECRSALSIPFTHVRAVISRIKIMSGLDISERRKPQDGKCVVKFQGNPIELRVATLPTVHGESAVMRILASSEPLPLEKLNFSDRNLEGIKASVASPHGVLLVVGPTGSGKTTTLHSILGYINTPEKKIWTAEDPVEITQPGLQQMQMKPEIGLNFASALRSFLRADPDVIMIGEMRDHETAHIGIEASLTGHLVFSTLHTNSAPETITRLLDLELDPVSFSDALLAVLAQRLVRTLCGECKEEYVIPEDEFTLLKRYYGEEYFDELDVKANETKIFKPKGCEKCGNTGYRGRTGIHELLVSTPEIKNLIYKKADVSEIKAAAIRGGMRTLMQDGIQKLFKGQTDIAQIRKVASA